jgi:hypothetical protein
MGPSAFEFTREISRRDPEGIAASGRGCRGFRVQRGASEGHNAQGIGNARSVPPTSLEGAVRQTGPTPIFSDLPSVCDLAVSARIAKTCQIKELQRNGVGRAKAWRARCESRQPSLRGAKRRGNPASSAWCRRQCRHHACTHVPRGSRTGSERASPICPGRAGVHRSGR